MVKMPSRGRSCLAYLRESIFLAQRRGDAQYLVIELMSVPQRTSFSFPEAFCGGQIATSVFSRSNLITNSLKF